jgi:hypothetical protein
MTWFGSTATQYVVRASVKENILTNGFSAAGRSLNYSDSVERERERERE